MTTEIQQCAFVLSKILIKNGFHRLFKQASQTHMQGSV